MPSIENFYELNAWKVAHILVLEMYKLTKKFPDDERFGMVSQMRRAVASITANIAEGFERYHYRDKIRFYHHSRASIAEVQSFSFIARDLGYISNNEHESLMNNTINVRKLVNGLIRSCEQQL